MSAFRSLMMFGALLQRFLRYARVDMGAELSEGGWAEYQRLYMHESLEFILDLLDYYVFYTYSMFQGRVVG